MANYTFKKTDGGPIDKVKAEKWMKRFKYKHGDEAIRAYFFGTDMIRRILEHPEAVGMRVYLSLNEDENDKTQMVLLGARADGSDIWIKDSGKDGAESGGDNGLPCPPYCS